MKVKDTRIGKRKNPFARLCPPSSRAGGFDADQRVIFLVLMGVDGVVAQGPEKQPGILNKDRADPKRPFCAAKPSSAPQLKVRPQPVWGHQVMRFMKG